LKHFDSWYNVAAVLSSLHNLKKKKKEKKKDNSGQFLRFITEHKSPLKLRVVYLTVPQNWLSL